MNLLKKLYEIHSPSGKEWPMKKFIKRYIKANIPGCKIAYDGKGNMYVIKGQSETYPCIVAHLDQVQKNHPKDFQAIEAKGMIFGYSSKLKSFCGLGADDKNGIWIALKALQHFPILKAVFFVEEEIGCRGSSVAEIGFFDDCRYVIQCDRKGSSDLITQIGWTDLCSNEFLKAIEPEKFGYHTQTGMMTDIEALKDNGLAVSAVNLSCGYYNPHTDEEITVIQDLENCKDFVFHIIENVTDVYPHTPNTLYMCRNDEIEELIDMLDYNCCIDPELTGEDVYNWYKDMYPSLKLEDFQRAVDEIKAYHEPLNNNEDYEQQPF